MNSFKFTEKMDSIRRNPVKFSFYWPLLAAVAVYTHTQDYCLFDFSF